VVSSSRSRSHRCSRGLALWLIVAQFILFSAADLTHRHVTVAGLGQAATAAATLSPSAVGTRVAAPGHLPNSEAGCPICQAVQSTTVSMVVASTVAILAAPRQPAPTYAPHAAPALFTRPSSARAPPVS
jgi:hypothetical protein